MDHVLPILFLNDDGAPLEFSIRGLPSSSSVAVHLIKKGGGIVHARRDGPHTIVLDTQESRLVREEENFDCRYIPDCCDANCLLDLNKYRLNKNSKYIEGYDANLVLLKKKSWKDIPLQCKKKSDDEETDIELQDDDIFLESFRYHQSLKNIARPYNESERLAMINWIIKNKSYASVGGNSLWMDMEKEEVCQGRSWQSLKEHFKKKVLPSINTFGLSEKHVKCFKKRRPY
ncbi:telomeric repeat-binding factor 2-interacting protein 1-like isoform X2 [Hetaerina americana]|uniref:telomeric repeat-binding factor 2-interacting protein 1-like isoform X2 n=1 Tax=Hetaerina americana TaxID=62018 RepID=UPI003A7F4056